MFASTSFTWKKPMGLCIDFLITVENSTVWQTKVYDSYYGLAVDEHDYHHKIDLGFMVYEASLQSPAVDSQCWAINELHKHYYC